MTGDPVAHGSPVDGGGAALAPFAARPEPDAAVLALVAAAADQLWTPRPVRAADETDPAHRVWRFSGRWWSKPTPLRRERPWSGR
jgi:hypothetical protein